MPDEGMGEYGLGDHSLSSEGEARQFFSKGRDSQPLSQGGARRSHTQVSKSRSGSTWTAWEG